MSKLLVYISDFCICKTKKDIILKIINLSAIFIGVIQSILTFFISGLELKICTFVLAGILAIVAFINMAFFSDKKTKQILDKHEKTLTNHEQRFLSLESFMNIKSQSGSSSHLPVKLNNCQALPNTNNYHTSIHVPAMKI